ncbi:MAG: sulfotransferase domain-containing protein [Anaerolineae bacterium]|nr:sulfotransferase domain-containing protein [Anaerolineae bacterium]
MINFDLLPNFFILGAAKSGTTSLFDSLALHPGIYPAGKKETRFFSNDAFYERGVEWYQAEYFSKAAGYPVRMEATPAYLNWSNKTAPRIHQLYGNHPLRFAVIFRDPVARAYSHYWHRVRQGDEDPQQVSFAEAIHTEMERIARESDRLEREGNGLYGYFRAGCYTSRLMPYLERFDRNQFFFLLQEDLVADFDASLLGLVSFLGLQPAGLRPIVSNESAIHRSPGVRSFTNALKHTALRPLIKLILPPSIRRWIKHRAMMKPFHYPPMDEAIRRELYAAYAEEIQALAQIIHRDLSHWRYQEQEPAG